MRRGSPFVSISRWPSAGALVLGVVVAAGQLAAVPAFACNPTFAFVCQAGQTIGRTARDAGHAIAEGAHTAGTAIATGAHAFGAAVGKTAHDVGNALRKETAGQRADTAPSGPAHAP